MKEQCKRMLERAILIIDGEEISYQERVEIETHLRDCEPCFERHGLDVEVKALIVRLRGTTTCPEGLKNKVSQILEEA
jgi:mycothiol system anti-sigma-R factor